MNSNMSTKDIYEAYRSGGTGNPYSKRIADYYNSQIAQLQSGNVNLINAKNGNIDNKQDLLKYNTNANNMNLYQNANASVDQLANEYQKALQNQSLGMQNAKKYMNNQLQANGLGQVGSSESTIAGISGNYQNNISNIAQAYQNGISDINNNLNREIGSNNRQLTKDLYDANAEQQRLEQLDLEKQQTAFANAINNATNEEDYKRILEMYKDVAKNKELDNAMYYKNNAYAMENANNSIQQALDNGNNSPDDLRKVLEQYKGIISDTDYNDYANNINDLETNMNITNLGGEFESENNILVDKYITGEKLSKTLDVAQGKEQNKLVQDIIDGVKNNEYTNGDIVNLNYGNGKAVPYVVYGNKLYKVTDSKKLKEYQEMFKKQDYDNRNEYIRNMVKGNYNKAKSNVSQALALKGYLDQLKK